MKPSSRTYLEETRGRRSILARHVHKLRHGVRHLQHHPLDSPRYIRSTEIYYMKVIKVMPTFEFLFFLPETLY